MKLETFFYTPQTGWSVASFPPLDSRQTWVIVFGGPDFVDTPEPVHEIIRAYPNSHIVGCSSSGEIFGTAITDNSLAVGVIQFQHTALVTTAMPVQSIQESYSVGRAIAQQLNRPSLRGLFILSDGLKVNGSELVRGLNTVLPNSVIVTGGLAGDGDQFKRTWVIQDGTLQSGFVSATGFYGEHVKIGHGSKGGWDIFGPERLVTRSDHNILYELDGKPALQIYKEYLGEQASGLPAAAFYFPLALRTNTSDRRRIVRTVLAIDEANQAIISAGDIPQGHLAQLMRGNFDHLVDGAAEAASMTHLQPSDTSPVLSIAVSCVGRRLVLGERTEEELEAAIEVLPPGTQQIGFYSYGEISPYDSGGQCDLHNQTMTLTTITEE
ncbi:MAG TPA: FIST N-terminal domain-containing protein [Anaerolineae bacterium]|nr:FIST N-terminal domain-containing protein [Anaerolineae bacterium]